MAASQEPANISGDILAQSDAQVQTLALEPMLDAAPAQVAAEAPTAAELEAIKAQVAKKDAVIEKLSAHLASALTRLNQIESPDLANQKLLAVLSAKTRLEKENTLLKQSVSSLQVEVAQTHRQLQLFDLENRRLVQAVGGDTRLPVAQIAQRYIDSVSNYASAH